jgi:CrcB protein
MTRILLVGLGGFLGSVARYLLGGAAQSLLGGATFPLGTVVVNLSGCFVIGVLSQLAESRGAFSDLTRALVFAGVLGGYTTFSTFANESVSLFRAGEPVLGSLNVLGQVAGGLLAVWLGRLAGQLVWR